AGGGSPRRRPSCSTMTEAGWSMRFTVPVTTVWAAAAQTSIKTSPPATMRVRANICVLPWKSCRSLNAGPCKPVASGIHGAEAFVIFTTMARRRRARPSKRRAPPPPARLGAGEARLLTLPRGLPALITTAPPSRLLDAALERLASGSRPLARNHADKTKALAAAWAHEQARLAMHEILEREARRGALRDDLSRPLLAWLLIAARD